MSLHHAGVAGVTGRAELDSLIGLARQGFGVGTAVLALATGEIAAVSSGTGDGAPVDAALCNLALVAGGTLVLDGSAFADAGIGPNAGAIRFYAGTPLRLSGGGEAGTLCLLDTEPRDFGGEERQRLEDTARIAALLLGEPLAARTLADRTLADLKSALIESMRQASERAASTARYKKMFDRASSLAKIGVWECELSTEALTWTDGVYDIFELPRGSLVTREVTLALYERESRLRMERLRRKAIEEGASCSLDIRIRTANGHRRWVRLTIDVEVEDGRAVRIFGLKQDVTQERDLLDRLRRLAEHDPMTGLANRSMFEGKLVRALSAPRATTAAALVLVDLDGFKEINDTHGHAAGDECLRQIGRRLKAVFRRPHVIGRIGGDEFAVLLHGARSAGEIERLVAEAIAAIRRPIDFAATRLVVGASVGISHPPDIRAYDLNALFAEADQAMYAAKKSGRDSYRFFGRDEGGEAAPPQAPCSRGAPAA